MILWFAFSLFVFSGKNTHLVSFEALNNFNVSRYLIYIAVLLFRMSDASLISFADSTSAWAEINFDSANLLSFAAEESESCKSWFNLMSFKKMFSIWTPLFL